MFLISPFNIFKILNTIFKLEFLFKTVFGFNVRFTHFILFNLFYALSIALNELDTKIPCFSKNFINISYKNMTFCSTLKHHSVKICSKK